jgi:hypothetical protein
MKEQLDSNIIKGVNYISTDLKENEYIVKAAQREIDLKDGNIIIFELCKCYYIN